MLCEAKDLLSQIHSFRTCLAFTFLQRLAHCIYYLADLLLGEGGVERQGDFAGGQRLCNP